VDGSPNESHARAWIMESLGEEHPTEVLQDYERRIPVSKALKCLREAIKSTIP
jgi:hypothetical protein